MSYLPPQLAPTMEAAFRDVTAKRPESRAAAAEALSSVGAEDRERARAAIRPLLDDAAPVVRVAALAALGRLHDEAALDAILARTRDEDPTVREVALIAASEIGGERALEAVHHALASDRPEMRFQAVAALALLAPDRARSHLLLRLEDDDARVRAHAAAALGGLEDDHAGTRRALAERLGDPSAEVRAEAALALARLGDARAIPELRRLLDHPDRALAAAEGLGALHAEEAREELATIARALLRPLMIKAAAAGALARIGDPRGVEALRAVLRALRADGRTYAVVVAGELALEALAPDLAALAERPRGADPVAIAEALAQLSHPDARAALARMARREDEAGERARELAGLPAPRA